MSKKQTKVKLLNEKRDYNQNEIKNKLGTHSNTSIDKMNKKEKKMFKKQLKEKNFQSKLSDKQFKQTIEVGLASEQASECVLEESQDLISLSSDDYRDNQQINSKLNSNSNEDFITLINEIKNDQFSEINYLKILRKGVNQSEEIYHFYHLKKQKFYKVTSQIHDKINTTHLKEAITIKIVHQNLIKNGFCSDTEKFWLNGKVLENQIKFYQSAIFKLVKNQSQKPEIRDDQKNSKNNLINQMRQNIDKLIRPVSASETLQLIQFLKDLEWNQECLVVAKQKLNFTLTTAPFLDIDTKILKSNRSLLIIGKKNTGKSTLAQYLKNCYPEKSCVLECDIGRSLSISGCVSLLTEDESINLWIGQFTPFNCIKQYVAAIKKLYQLYRQKYFIKKLVINTMGYLTGLGEIIIYQIYQLINPSQIIVIRSEQLNPSANGQAYNILKNIKSGAYFAKLLTLEPDIKKLGCLRRFNQQQLNLNIQYLYNPHSHSKGVPIRFENLLMERHSFKNIIELIKMIKNKQFKKIHNIQLYQQDKLGNVTKLNCSKSQADMRLLLIGRWLRSNQSESSLQKNLFQQPMAAEDKASVLFRVFGIGYGYEECVYASKETLAKTLSTINLDEQKNMSGIVCQGVDFEKNFYLLNQFNLIEYELEQGPLPYMLPIIKGIGSKGMRNNPSKNA